MKKSAAIVLLAMVGGLFAAATTAPSNIAPARGERECTPADYETHAANLRKILPAGFTVIVQAPFIVAGDDTPEAVQASATHTVQWAVDHLKKDYFDKDPAAIIDIYLFKDRTSYLKYTKLLFDDEPGTPYGYYSPLHKALIMNISTGGGTLVHEIVHPFVAANFPNCPPWFNEGLGSLYEQSAERDGHIIGMTNWRLPGLQKAIIANKVPLFKDLFAMDNDGFYSHDRGTNYGQSRYLLYYLQEKNLLRDYYMAFVKNQKTDPTGIETLQEILGEKDLPAFQDRWQKWVLTLHYP